MADLGNLKSFSHNVLNDLVRAFAPNIPNKGVCNGFTSMWLQAVATSDEQENHFYARLNGLSKYLSCSNASISALKTQVEAAYAAQKGRADTRKSLTVMDAHLFEIRAFAESIAVQQDPTALKIFPEYTTQRDKKQLYQLTASKVLSEGAHLSIIKFDTIGTIAADKQILEQYFNDLKTILETYYQANPTNRKIGFLLGSDNHAIGVYFHPQLKVWHFLDINQLSGKTHYYFSVDSQGLADLIFESYFDKKSHDTAFTIHYVSTIHDDKLVASLKIIANNLLVSSKDRKNSRGYNTLLLSSIHGNASAVKILFESGQKRKIKDSKSCTPLMYASWNTDPSVADTILSTHKKRPTGIIGSLLFTAESAFEFCSSLVENNINDVDKDGFTALMIAANIGNIKVVDLLIKKGANTGMQSKAGQTALMLAAQMGHTNVVKALINTKKENSWQQYLSTALFSIQNPSLVANQFLITDLELMDNQGSTALMFAALYNKTETVEFLASQNACIHKKNLKGNTALMLAAQNRCYAAVALLISRGAKLEHKNLQGNTALMLAAQNGNFQIVTLLIQHGAKVNQINKQGLTALSLAKQIKCEKTTEILTQHGAIERKTWRFWLQESFCFNKKASLSSKQMNKKLRF